MKASEVIAALANLVAVGGSDQEVLIGDIDGEQISDIYLADEGDQIIIEHFVT